MFHRLRMGKKFELTPEQIARQKEAEETKAEARKELLEAKELAVVLRNIREKNHFAEGFRKSLGGSSGH